MNIEEIAIALRIKTEEHQCCAEDLISLSKSEQDGWKEAAIAWSVCASIHETGQRAKMRCTRPDTLTLKSMLTMHGGNCCPTPELTRRARRREVITEDAGSPRPVEGTVRRLYAKWRKLPMRLLRC